MKLRTALLAIASTAAALLLFTGSPTHAAHTTVQPVPNAAPVAYTVEMKTGERDGAGTDANVSIRIHGSIRISSWVPLENPGDDRERGDLDVYGPIYLSDLGSVHGIEINFDDSGDNSDWFLDWVQVYPTLSGAVSFFEIYGWLKKAGMYPFDAS